MKTLVSVAAARKADTIFGMVTLAPEQVAFFHREGYLVLPAITTQEEVAWLRGIYDRLFETRAGRENGDQFDLGSADEEGKPAVLPQILSPQRYAPELLKSQYRTNAFSVARQLLGAAAEDRGEHMIYKPPLVGAETPWHQDEAYWSGDWEYNSIGIWMPLQDVTLENGCMQFLPRSNHGDILPHRPIGRDHRVHGLELEPPVDVSKAVACPIPAGGCTIHSGRTVHYTGPNRTAHPRRAYIMNFGLPNRKRDVPRDFYWNRQKQPAREQRAREAAARAAKSAAATGT